MPLLVWKKKYSQRIRQHWQRNPKQEDRKGKSEGSTKHFKLGDFFFFFLVKPEYFNVFLMFPRFWDFRCVNPLLACLLYKIIYILLYVPSTSSDFVLILQWIQASKTLCMHSFPCIAKLVGYNS